MSFNIKIEEYDFELKDGYILKIKQYNPPNKIKSVFLTVGYNNIEQIEDLVKDGYIIITTIFRDDNIELLENDIYELYVFLNNYYQTYEIKEYEKYDRMISSLEDGIIGCNVGIISMDIGCFVISKMIDNNNIYKINPEFVFFISPITNPIKRIEYFNSLINNKKHNYHHKQFENIISYQKWYFKSDRNIRYYSKFIHNFDTNSNIILILEKDNIFSNKYINDDIIKNKKCFTYIIDDNISKYSNNCITELFNDIMTTRFTLKKIEY